MPNNVELCQALSARICHDLSGAIGTISNCFGLIDNSNKSIKQKAKDLVSEESSNLVNKIKFFRGAYGLNNHDEISIITLMKLIKDFLDSDILKVNIKFQEGLISLSPQVAQTLICLVAVASDAVISGGTIDVYIGDDGRDIKITVQGKDIIVKEECFNVLAGEKQPITVSNCREHYINGLCKTIGYKLSTDKSDQSLSYNLQKS